MGSLECNSNPERWVKASDHIDLLTAYESEQLQRIRIADQLASFRSAYDKLKADVARWRDNYRAILVVQFEENNRLREAASYEAVKVHDLAAALKHATRKRWWQIWR